MHPRRHLDRVGRFSTIHARYRERETDRQRNVTGSNRLRRGLTTHTHTHTHTTCELCSGVTLNEILTDRTRYTVKNIRISTHILRRVFHISTEPRASLFRRFTDTNVRGAGSVKIRKTRYKIYVDVERYFLQCSVPPCSDDTYDRRTCIQTDCNTRRRRADRTWPTRPTG